MSPGPQAGQHPPQQEGPHQGVPSGVGQALFPKDPYRLSRRALHGSRDPCREVVHAQHGLMVFRSHHVRATVGVQPLRGADPGADSRECHAWHQQLWSNAVGLRPLHPGRLQSTAAVGEAEGHAAVPSQMGKPGKGRDAPSTLKKVEPNPGHLNCHLHPQVSPRDISSHLIPQILDTRIVIYISSFELETRKQRTAERRSRQQGFPARFLRLLACPASWLVDRKKSCMA